MSKVDSALLPVVPELSKYVRARRWFRGKTRNVIDCTLGEAIPLPLAGARAWLGIVGVHYAEGDSDEYALPLMIVDREGADSERAKRPHLVVASLPDGGAILDALADPHVLRGLLALVGNESTLKHGESALRFTKVEEAIDELDAVPRPIEGEQSNTSILFGNSYILKVVRKLDIGASADVEMGRFLTRAKYTHAPAVAGIVELVRGRKVQDGQVQDGQFQDGQVGDASHVQEPATVAILNRYVPNRGDGWTFFLERLTKELSQISGDGAILAGASKDGGDRALIVTLATRIAEMHVALASRPDLPMFAPEPISKEERGALAAAVRASLRAAFDGLRAQSSPEGKDVLAHGDALEAILDDFVNVDVAVQKMRVHGDLHLGQVLVSGDDFVLIDFEGEPARPLAERKAKRSPLVDVAGMLRSLHYASVSAARAASAGSAVLSTKIASRAEAWQIGAEAALLDAYRAGAQGASFLPGLPGEHFRALLDFYLLEKCVYEIHYEMNNRPDWMDIPLRGLARLIEARHER